MRRSLAWGKELEAFPILAEISDFSLGLMPKKSDDVRKHAVRLAARAILVRRDGKIALMKVSKWGYHKLPGGGVNLNESVESALERELLEETGVSSKTYGLLGVIVETRRRFRIVQVSYCFLAKALAEGRPRLEKGELAEGFKLEWFKPQEAVRILKADRPRNYGGKFIVARDLRFLQGASRQPPAKFL